MIDTVIHGDCLDVLPDIPDASVDAVITDPPYPCIKRDYGVWTEAEWWEMVVEGVVPQVRRVLKPTGSAVFILQPNSRKVGSMRGWLFEFQAWVCREWNMVQDVYWWNYTTSPTAPATHGQLMRTSIKACVWCGQSSCYREQDNILWQEAESTKAWRQGLRVVRDERIERPSGWGMNLVSSFASVEKRGGVTPFNLLPMMGNNRWNGAGVYGHSAGTPLALADWWTRYIVPPGGTVLDPFFGVGTMALAAIKNRCHFIGIEKEAHYCEAARERIAQAQEEHAQLELEL